MNIRSKLNPKVEVSVIAGHFAPVTLTIPTTSTSPA